MINFKNRFWDSMGKILLLIFFTFLPLILNIVIAIIPASQKINTMASKIIPGEMIAYCLSFISPLFLFMLKTHGKSFKVPGLKLTFVLSIFLYSLCLFLSLIAKNGFIGGIDLQSGHGDLYFWLSLVFLFLALILRFFTDYQDSRYLDYKAAIDKDQQNFNTKFSNSI